MIRWGERKLFCLIFRCDEHLLDWSCISLRYFIFILIFKRCLMGWNYFHHSEKCYKLVKERKRKIADAEAYCKEKSGNKVRSWKGCIF